LTQINELRAKFGCAAGGPETSAGLRCDHYRRLPKTAMNIGKIEPPAVCALVAAISHSQLLAHHASTARRPVTKRLPAGFGAADVAILDWIVSPSHRSHAKTAVAFGRDGRPRFS
jgi:hypothetical protein